MNFSEVVAEIKKIAIEELRSDTSKWFESVFDVAHQEALEAILQKHLGPAYKPAGKGPDKKAQEHTADFGGIRSDQTLYLYLGAQESVCAMIWPWGNGERFTLRMAHYESK